MQTIIDSAARFGFSVAAQGFNSRDMGRLDALTADRFSGNLQRMKAARAPHLYALFGLCAILTIELPKAGYGIAPKPMSVLELDYQSSLGDYAYQMATIQLLATINCVMERVPASLVVPTNLFDALQAESEKLQNPPKKEEPPAVQRIEIVSMPPLAITSMPGRNTESTVERDAKGDITRTTQRERDAA